MATITVDIDDQNAERKVTALLDKLGLNYSITADTAAYNWWGDNVLIQELDKRSEDLKTGHDKGASFEEAKQRILAK